MSRYCVQEANYADVHEVTEYGDFLVFISDYLGDIWYHDRFHMLNLVMDCFNVQMCHTGSIDVLSHPDIFSQNWEVLQDVIINCV